MKTFYKILIIFLSFAVPYLLLVLITLAAFFQFGSGSNSAEKFEAQENWWIAFYTISAIINIILVYRLQKPWNLFVKWIVLILLTATYIYFGLEFIY